MTKIKIRPLFRVAKQPELNESAAYGEIHAHAKQKVNQEVSPYHSVDFAEYLFQRFHALIFL